MYKSQFQNPVYVVNIITYKRGVILLKSFFLTRRKTQYGLSRNKATNCKNLFSLYQQQNQFKVLLLRETDKSMWRLSQVNTISINLRTKLASNRPIK